jgi:hypothetical protein
MAKLENGRLECYQPMAAIILCRFFLSIVRPLSLLTGVLTKRNGMVSPGPARRLVRTPVSEDSGRTITAAEDEGWWRDTNGMGPDQTAFVSPG